MSLPKLPPDNLNPAVIEPVELTPEQKINHSIRVARDSVWVITSELSREFFRNESLSLLKSNVAHLELVMSNSEIANCGQDLSDITEAIELGKNVIAILEGQ